MTRQRISTKQCAEREQRGEKKHGAETRQSAGTKQGAANRPGDSSNRFAAAPRAWRVGTWRLGAWPLSLACLVAALGAWVPALVVGADPAAAPTVDFGRHVRPVLAEKCFSCHGLDEKKRATGLRLDTKDGLFAEIDSGGVAVTPGQPEQSVVYQRLVSADPDERMPPAKAKQLTPAEIDVIKRWIQEGAGWTPHWSLVAPRRPAPPAVGDAAWPRNAIDHFILARLEREKLKPSAEADPITLLRRVTYDLTGLPPTLAEIEAFLADAGGATNVGAFTKATDNNRQARLDRAYEKAVDRLLESPRHGEHAARYWLDAARYGDTHGLHLDNHRRIWPYRDWVIQAFNTNMPFDQFTIEQLAGDLLPSATLSQKVATGFNRCNVTTSEGGALAEEYEVHYTNDRVATMSTVWMAASMGCVTCHDHKFDPFDMKDYYQLYAFFNSLEGPVMDGNAVDTAPVVKAASPEQQAELARLETQIHELAEAMKRPLSEVDQAQRAWEEKSRAEGDAPKWTTLAAEKITARGGASVAALEDGSLLVGGPNPDVEVYEITAPIASGKLTALRLEGLPDASLPGGAAGRSPNGNVVLTEFEAEAASAAEPEKFTPVQITRAWADHEQPDGDFKIANAIDGKKSTGWAINGHVKKEPRVAIFAAAAAFGHDGPWLLRARLRHESIFKQHQFGRFRLAITSAESIPELGPKGVSAEIAAILRVAPAERNAAQRDQLRDHYRAHAATQPEVVKTREGLAAARARKTDLENAVPTTLVWKETAQPKPAHILTRGDYDKKGAVVTRGTPAALPPLALPEGETPTRLHLARWLLTAEHPLTARVTVNRFWQRYFGVGLVETVDDFGSQGAPPSHPELLDWLAVEFRESGWNVKRAQKLIVMSATYRQSAKWTPELARIDPRNRLLARGPRFRLDAEMIRDTALAASGLLVGKIGGPSVKPYQPAGVWEAVGYTDSNTARFTRDTGEALYRRSLYTFWKRTAPPPTLATLDAPSRETCTVRRSRTNTPLAALALMNDEQFVEAARHLAARMLREGGESDAARAAHGFRLVATRSPTESETQVLLEVLRASLAKFQADKEAAGQLIRVGESPPDATLDPSQLAAWTMVANLLLNLDEAITKN